MGAADPCHPPIHRLSYVALSLQESCGRRSKVHLRVRSE